LTTFSNFSDPIYECTDCDVFDVTNTCHRYEKFISESGYAALDRWNAYDGSVGPVYPFWIGDVCGDVGTSELIPSDSSVEAGDRMPLTLRWTHPVRWRELDSLDLRLVAEDGEVAVWAKFTEATNEFAICRNEGDCQRKAAPGSPVTLHAGPWADLLAAESRVQGSGPDGQSVDVTFVLRLRPKAAGHVFRVEALAADDAGNRQGTPPLGTVTVSER
ncbi:MAG: hypothetical protein ACREQ9_11540, partial [Candidatus Binatia bacterium]